jgi:hypothetical protein
LRAALVARAVLALALPWASRWAHAAPVSLAPLDRATLVSLDGAARRGELALVESKPDGTMRQVSMIVFVRAPAAAVRALVADVGGYVRFVPNLKRADFRQENGRWVNDWKLELPISSFSGRDEYELEPAPLGVIRFHSLESLATYEWQFVPVDGGCLLVETGYTDVLHANRFVRAFVARIPSLEHGLALAAQYMLVSAIKHEAERRAGGDGGPMPPVGDALERLSQRGQAVVMRAAPDGKLAEVSVVDHAYASEEGVRQVIGDPAAYRDFMAGVQRSEITERIGVDVEYVLELALPILTWATTYRARIGRHAVDGAGVAGDLLGARFRWDLQRRGERDTLVTYRANQPLARSSAIVRKLFAADPSLEYGLNVAFALSQVRAVRGRAEGWR